MKIAIVNTYSNGGGAARAANRLHQGLQQIGHESFMYVQHGSGKGVVSFQPDMSFINKVERKFRSKMIGRSFSRYVQSRPLGVEDFADDRSSYGANSIKNIPDCDVINLHWVAGFVNYASLPMIANKPIVWTLHDMNPFTGGCHYDNGCDGYMRECGTCPQLGSIDRNDLSNSICKRKQVAFNQLNPEVFRIVTPSNWLADVAKRSALFSKFNVSVIPNGLDKIAFAPRNSSELRRVYDISSNAQVILFLADSVEKERKGFQYLLDALVLLERVDQFVLVSVGSGERKLHTSLRHVHIGRVEAELILSMIYSMADVFVIPSVQDNLPNTVLESMACGTPVVGFNIGGIPDMVRDGQTGFVVSAGDVVAMKIAIEKILGDAELRNYMSQQCRDVAVKEYDLKVQARRYAELYGSLVK